MKIASCTLACLVGFQMLDRLQALGLVQRGPSWYQLSRAARRAQALSDPERLAIAYVLGAHGEATVSDLVEVSAMMQGTAGSQSRVSHHLAVLRREKLVRAKPDQFDARARRYRLTQRGRSLAEAILNLDRSGSERLDLHRRPGYKSRHH